jgi:hypothetical protein
METIRARVPVKSLFELSEFLSAAEQLKGLLLWREELRCRDSGLLRSLDRQIGTMVALCEKHAEKNKLLADAWREAERELAKYMEERNDGEETPQE